MARDLVYFDLETQRTANDAGGWDRKGNMQMSVGVIYSTRRERYEIFPETRVHDLIDRLRAADLVIGLAASGRTPSRRSSLNSGSIIACAPWARGAQPPRSRL